MAGARPWSQAWQEALYGSAGLFASSRPLRHFRTSVANPLFAVAVRQLAGRVDEALGRPDPFDLVDLGAGGGELLSAVPDVPPRWRLAAVDLAPAPPGADGRTWSKELPALTGLLLANEWLDAVPLDVVEDGRLVLVEADGTEVPGPAAGSLGSRQADLAWARRWWPQPGRVELGAGRDLAWAAAVRRVRRGLAVAVDYDHRQATRRPTLTGYRAGRQVAPAPDGTRDLTAHVALDSCAAATGGRVLRQAVALAHLGVSAALPAANDPAYAQRLQQASWAAELLDPAGLGGFGWLTRQVGLPAGSIGW